MINLPAHSVSNEHWAYAQVIWNYLRLGHSAKPCSAAIGLGSHDLGVAVHSVQLYHEGLFPILVFSGSNSPTTRARFPRGEAVHYREYALDQGVPDEAILVEPLAGNTGQNIALSREVLAAAIVPVDSLLLISKPYMERRAYATCRRLWPEVEVRCASQALRLDRYVAAIGDAKLVIDMLVGELQRLLEYPKLGYAVAQDVPESAQAAYLKLLDAGFDSRLMRT